MTTSVATSDALTEEAVTDLVIELLGDYLHEDAGKLRTRLLTEGTSMPVDSLDLFDILSDFRKRTGISLPVRRLRRDTMRSVAAFAAFVVEVAATP